MNPSLWRLSAAANELGHKNTMQPIKAELWHAVYKRQAAGSKAIELVALLKREEDATGWEYNPDLFFHCCRRVVLRPAPIAVSDSPAEELLDAIVNGPDEHLGQLIEDARRFLKKRAVGK